MVSLAEANLYGSGELLLLRGTARVDRKSSCLASVNLSGCSIYGVGVGARTAGPRSYGNNILASGGRMFVVLARFLLGRLLRMIRFGVGLGV